ncbi:MAG: AMP-binding protein [Gemmatimonadota bacterium]
MFPFGVNPGTGEDDAADGGGRGPDTVCRLLLHGARYHERDAAFLHWGQGRQGWGWLPTPDWRADRAAIRVGLVLHQRMQLMEKERVALWIPLDDRWGVVERGVWSVGAVSVPVWPEWPLERVAAVLEDAAPAVLFAPDVGAIQALRAIGGFPESVQTTIPLRASEASGEDWLSYDKLMEYGGVLDTPERASMWRTYNRAVEPDAVISYEYGAGDAAPGEPSFPGERREMDHGTIVGLAEALARKFPARQGRVQVLAVSRPTLLARALLYAGWADGLTRTAFAAGRPAQERVGELAPALALCDGKDAPLVLQGMMGASADEPVGRLGGPLRLRRANGASPAAARAVEAWVVVADGPASPDLVATSGRIRLLAAAELEGELNGSVASGP